MWKSGFVATAALLGLGVMQMGGSSGAAPSQAASTTITDQLRAELFAAREAAWRAFFSNDPARLETLLGPEVIAIQQSQENWEDRDQLVAMAHGIQRYGVGVRRLEFPRTEIQVFGDVAVMYYTYIFETGDGQRSVTDSGRGTEIFVRRDGRWVDVGWHLDNGAFVRRDGAWTRISPEPAAVEQPAS